MADAKDELSQTQKDREYDIRKEGYQGLSDDLNSALEDTLDEVKYNSSKQEQVISEMLNHVVNNYKDAYDKINQIIGNTGFKPSDDFQQNIGNLGTQSGANSQIQDSNTIAPNYTPDDFVSGTNTGQIQSGSSQSNNDKIESEIEKEPNTTNRPIAQLTVKPTSISIQEGQSKNVSVTIRPTDAANKTLKWTSSNSKVATASNGTIKSVKPGSCQITVSTTDGTLTFTCEGVSVDKKFSWTKSIQATNAVMLQIYAPQGNVIVNAENNVLLEAQITDGGSVIESGVTYQWAKFDGGKYTDIPSANQNTITVTPDMVNSLASFRCTVGYNGRNYIAYWTVTDKNDPVELLVMSTVGTQLTKDADFGVIYVLAYLKEKEIDAIKSTVFSTTPPSGQPDNICISKHDFLTQKALRLIAHKQLIRIVLRDHLIIVFIMVVLGVLGIELRMLVS